MRHRNPGASGYSAMFGVLALISWGLHYRHTGDLRLLFVAGTVLCGALAVMWLVSSFWQQSSGGSGRASGMVLVGGLILLGSLLGGDFDAGSRGARMPSFSESSYLGRGLMYLGYAVAAIAGLVALWPANRCPVCGSRRCRCYDRAR